MERFIHGENRGNYPKPSMENLYPVAAVKPRHYSFTYLSDLPENHKAVEYVSSRGIPASKWEDIGYTEDVSKLAREFDEKYDDRFQAEDRLVIVIRNDAGICGFQCRSFNKETKRGLKYFTIKRDEELCYYGLNTVDTSRKFYIVEGPINSMFIENSIATLGSSNFQHVSDKMDDTNAVYVIDNEPFKIETLKILQSLIDAGKTVCIFPSNIPFKDLNDMATNGLDVQKLIDDNTFSGLKARMAFNTWKKMKI